LFNHLLERNRAIVSHIPGTTRDYIEETLFIDGISIKLIDTAGIRETEDVIEIEGIKMVESIMEQSNMILVLNDISISQNHSIKLHTSIKEKYPNAIVLLVQNKTDLIAETTPILVGDLSISAKKDTGLDELKERLAYYATSSKDRIDDILVNQRQSYLLRQSASSLETAINALDNGFENELISIDIRQASHYMGEITGDSWSNEVLNNIFAKFCIGK
jgi:tRNA modification GTPase